METGLFARHAETEYSVRALVNGDPSVPVGLTEAGKEQARVAGAMAGSFRLPIQCMFSS